MTIIRTYTLDCINAYVRIDAFALWFSLDVLDRIDEGLNIIDKLGRINALDCTDR